jgi:hypothetical protein
MIMQIMKYQTTKTSLKMSSCIAIIFDQASIVVHTKIVKNALPMLSKFVIP